MLGCSPYEYFLERMANENPTTKVGRSRILDTFIKSVTIHSDRVEIVFNYKNEMPEFSVQSASGSHFSILVGPPGIEPGTDRL